ncbi:uncharacterized protein LOC106087277 [Stomoxys calcitrans]|uniref:uncharacterized protein LOC106087277 n=1 Tax=Stomoxys calcitrans TaxID=35570 RepID=UPI0027E23E23|nr:uncharacterized protein LOC106087277 [Stomoxys calcitrans]
MSDNNNNTDKSVKSAIPKWIEAKLFEDALKEAEPQFQSIEEFKIEPALAPGENYISLMLKAEFVIKLKDDSVKAVSFMLKVCNDSEVLRKMTKEHNVFDIEAGMYRDVVPELEQILRSAGINARFGARTYSLPTEESYILLENLKEYGFSNTNRLEGLDMPHIQSVLKKLAQWHAASAFRVVTKGKYADAYSKGYLKPESYEMFKEMYNNVAPIILDCIRQYSNFDVYYDQISKLMPQMTDELFKAVGIGAKEDDEEFKVLNHGDAWSNNIMFQYDEESGDISETYLVDYQIPLFTSPAQDLWYLIMTSCKYEIKLAKFEEMIAFYHKHLDKYLRILKYPKKIPTLKDLHCMLLKQGVWAFSTAMNVMAIVLCDRTEDANMDNFISETESGLAFKKLMYTNARYRKHMEAILPWLLNRGLLECTQ